MHTREMVDCLTLCLMVNFDPQYFDEAWSDFRWLSRDTYKWDHGNTTLSNSEDIYSCEQHVYSEIFNSLKKIWHC